mmetsp:Transcript_39000/g.63029  ORF Transcript_39000/g.63029 Transcript_39000/m.63029 type:complete len:96 (+) Transcript_39000:275-562(+)
MGGKPSVSTATRNDIPTLHLVMDDMSMTASMTPPSIICITRMGCPKRPQLTNATSEATNGPCCDGKMLDMKYPAPAATKLTSKKGKKKFPKRICG